MNSTGQNPKPTSLRIPAYPEFPFSSPILEEDISPSTCSEDRDTDRQHHDLEGYRFESDQNPFLSASETRNEPSPSATRAGGQPDAMDRSNDRPRQLNVVTKFDKSQPRVLPKAGAFVDLSDLKMLSKSRPKEWPAYKIKEVFRKRTSEGFRKLRDEDMPVPEQVERMDIGLNGHTHSIPASGTRVGEDLSPSDRPIVIGITVPVETSGTSGPQSAKSGDLDSACSQPTPITPSIVITPAREDPDWHLFENDSHPRPRPASSVYSQPSPYPWHHSEDIPPVPAVPVIHYLAQNERASPDSPDRECSTLSEKKQRSLSTCTVFEEDDSPVAMRRPRSFSNESMRKVLQRLSVNTEAVRHQSQGWWTYLLSPLIGRSNTVSSHNTAAPDERERERERERPPVPPLTTQNTGSTDLWWEKETSYFSPDTPETAVTNKEDIKPIGWQGAQRDIHEEGKPANCENTDVHDDTSSMSAMFPGRTVQGSAAEYYQACAHELFSGTPYFECVDHICSITPKCKIPSITTANEDASGVEKSLALFDPDSSVHRESGSSVTAVDENGSSRTRSDSDSTAIEEDEGSPITHNEPSAENAGKSVKVAPIATPRRTGVTSRLNQLDSQQPASPPATHTRTTSPVGPPPYTTAPVGRSIQHHLTIFPTIHRMQPETPGPTSPAWQRTMARNGCIPLADIESAIAPAPPAAAHRPNVLPQRARTVTIDDITSEAERRKKLEARRRRLEREDAVGRRVGGLWRGRGPFSKNGCFGRPGREGRLRRRWYIASSLFFLTIIVVAIVLATTLTRKGDGTPVQSQWLNLTGYPPMPTGIATIAGPNNQAAISGCIAPPTLWSCALPPEQQAGNQPYGATQPNFRVEIVFRNGTFGNSTTTATRTQTVRRQRFPRLVDLLYRSWIRERSFDRSFASSPPPPSMPDQTFLGNTTDKNTVPFEGETTPFFISILSPLNLPPSRLMRRDGDPFPNLTSIIPPPSLNPDGTATDAILYPRPSSQPIRLYNRGQATEHYGFYTYFDRSIFLDTLVPLNGGTSNSDPNDVNGGSSKSSAQVQCIWAQTRFLVQIWTQPSRAGLALLNTSSQSSSSSSSSASSSTGGTTNVNTHTNTTTSSANDFTQPGSFPYPITITLDRHGGDPRKKMVYCYGMAAGERVDPMQKKLQLENRAIGGLLVNPAPGIFGNTGGSSSAASSSSPSSSSASWAGGFDGGTGGCSCQWVNWIAVV